MQEQDHIPFAIDSVYWIYNFASEPFPYDHQSQQVERVIVALSGSFDVVVRDGTNASMVSLYRSSKGLYIPRIYDFALSNLSSNAIALVLASAPIKTIKPETDIIHANPEVQINARSSTVDDCQIIRLPQQKAPPGTLTFLRSGRDGGIPIRRVYHLFDVPEGASRGGHSHRELHQYVLAAHGSFEVHIDDGHKKRTINLGQPDCALHLLPGIWRELYSFSKGSICLVIASDLYKEQDYLRNYNDFRSLKRR